MPYKKLIESPERAIPRMVNDQSSPDSGQSFQNGLHPIPQLQRTMGNRNIAQLIQARRLTPEGKITGLQRKLTVGAADDQYEQEADRVAHQVMNTPDAAVASNSMQRVISPEEDKDKTLQTKPLAAAITPFVQRDMVNNEKPEEEEKPVQAKFLTGTSRKPVQRQPEEDKDKMLQTKPLADTITPFVQRDMVNNEKPEEEKPVQAKFLTGTSRKPLQRQPEEDKNKMLQTRPIATSIAPFVQREMENNEEWKEKEMPVQARFLARTNQGPLQRQDETDEQEFKPVQPKSSGLMSGSFEARDDVETKVSQSKGHGSPLPDSVRAYMEPRFGVDFSHIRVHTGSDAIQMNRDVGAKAFTHGYDIYYGADHSPANLELTAHELTHVVQQTGCRPLHIHPKRLDQLATSGSERSMQRICSACSADKEKKESDLRTFSLQRTIGDGHDFLPASRFTGNATLEGVFDNERVLQSGSTGAPVTLVQQALIALGYALPRFGADGEFGDETKRAVVAFQRDAGLNPDGRVGFRTIDFLDKRDRGAEVAPPVRPVVANAPFNIANAIAQPGAAPSNALGAGVWGLTFPENVQVTIDVFDNGGVWQPVLTGVTGNYSLQTRLLPGVNEVTGPGGNTNAGNYCAQINDLNSLNGANWYMLSAVLAHERIHARQFRTALIHPSVITPLETAIEAITTPVTFLTPNAGVAELFIRLDPAFNAALNAAQANWLAQILVLVAGDHTPGGRTDTEEHAIVDPMRRRICQHARANGWPACPPLCP